MMTVVIETHSIQNDRCELVDTVGSSWYFLKCAHLTANFPWYFRQKHYALWFFFTVLA